MPGVIMENGSRNGSHTNHDRDQRPNGINGASHAGDQSQDKGKGRAEPQQNVTPISPTIPNGLNGNFMEDIRQQRSDEHPDPQNTADRMHKLPPEIAHITQGYMPLSTLLSRLAQKTHTELGTAIRQLAQMPVPASAAAANSNASHISTVDDNSVENINKKLRMLKFTQDAHAEWTKALVIAEWSRKSEDISKMIDLRVYLFNQIQLYSMAIDSMILQKRNLYQARLPSPDLRTALEVLTTGKAPWMPELGYIQPPPLTAKEILKSLENLNTLLSMRLNLHDYDSTPPHFRDYNIHSGRVTFKVTGEFEIDLTIADEDPDNQFWFIDFRFSFWPSSSDLAPHLLYHIENRVNEALLRDGLSGCYKFLHEMVLTHKITEFRRQAFDLARGKMIEGLKIELLNRTLSIQYWLDRYHHSKGSKSWILLGVHSGRPKHGRQDPKMTSRLFIRWLRDSKEVKDVDIQFDTVNISTEVLLKSIIAKHVTHILTSIHEKLRVKALFVDHDFSLSLSTSSTEPAESVLHIQLTHSLHVSVRIEPVTGRFIFGPASQRVVEYEQRLNRTQDPAADAYSYIEMLRCVSMLDEIQSLGTSVGWAKVSNPGLKQDQMKLVMPKDTAQVGWFRRAGWAKDWYLAVSLAMSGERWLLIENATSSTIPPGSRIASVVKIPIKVASPVPTYAFLSTLNVFAAALLSHYSNLKALHSRRALHILRNTSKPLKGIVLPAMYIRLSELLPSSNKSSRTGKPWAKDVVKLTFQGLEIVPREQRDSTIVHSTPQPQVLKTPLPGNQHAGAPPVQTSPSQDEIAVMVTEARMIVPLPKPLTTINEMVDRDIAFHSGSGSFAFRLRSRVGESVIPGLIERAVRVERLVEFVQVLQNHEASLKCETVALGKITFNYGDNPQIEQGPGVMDIDKSLVAYTAVVDFSALDNIVNLVLERGNPHLRILDHLTKVLNDKQGLDGVATLLPLTLPVLRGFDSIETAWTPLTENGEAYVYVRAAEWYVIRYNMFQPAPADSDALPKPRRVMFEVRMRQRRGVPWWYVRRTDNRDRDGDDLDLALKPVWNSSGPGWQGMRVSGVAQVSGIEELLGKMDEVVREVATHQQTAPQSAATQAIAPVRAPAANQHQRQQHNQRQQQTTPNLSQTQSQTQRQERNNPMKREIVEID